MSNIPNRDTFAGAYADKAPWDINGPQPPLAAVAERVEGSVLDAGCGTGENALFFAARGHAVTGIDFLEVPIERARQKAAERNLRTTFLVHDALELESLNQQFDTVIDSGLFHVFGDDDRARYVSSLAGVLKPGGRLIMLCFSDAEPGTVGPRRVSQSELRTAFADGWEIESIEPVRFQTAPGFEEMFSAGGPQAWLTTVRRAG